MKKVDEPQQIAIVGDLTSLLVSIVQALAAGELRQWNADGVTHYDFVRQTDRTRVTLTVASWE